MRGPCGIGSTGMAQLDQPAANDVRNLIHAAKLADHDAIEVDQCPVGHRVILRTCQAQERRLVVEGVQAIGRSWVAMGGTRWIHARQCACDGLSEAKNRLTTE